MAASNLKCNTLPSAKGGVNDKNEIPTTTTRRAHAHRDPEGGERQVYSRERAHLHAVVQRIFLCLVGRSTPLLEAVDAQHPFLPDRRPASPFLGVVRLDRCQQPKAVVGQPS